MADRGNVSYEESISIQQKIISDFAQKMEAGGITDEKLIEILKEKIQAKEEKPFNDKGQIIYSKKMEAHDIQLKAVDMVLKLKGRYPSEKHDHTITGVVAGPELTEEDRLQVEAIKEVLRQKNREK